MDRKDLERKMKSQRKVAIVLAGYNETAIVDKAMEETYGSLKDNFDTFELILVDDASKDDTYEKMDHFARCHEGVIFLPNLVNLNFGTSVLRGMMASKMDYVTFNACDLGVRPDVLVKLLKDMPDDTDVLVMERKKYRATGWRTVTSGVNKMLQNILFPKLMKGTPVLNYSQVYKRDKLDKILPLARSPIFVAGADIQSKAFEPEMDKCSSCM